LGGIPYAIGTGGWVVEPTVDALATVLPRARTEAPALSAPARTRYLETFHPSVVTDQLLATYTATASTRS
jgi:hypothetical protein